MLAICEARQAAAAVLAILEACRGPPCRMDSLKALGCCHIYSQRDYTLEGEAGGSDNDAHADHANMLAKKKAAGGLDAYDCPPSPTIMARWGGRWGEEGAVLAQRGAEPGGRPP